jgi:prolyl oligopeptidase
MSRVSRVLAGCTPLAALLLSVPAIPSEGGARLTAPVYPKTRRDDVVELQFGERVADPYRWLEKDARTDKEVADWVARQSTATRAYLARLPGRETLAARIRSATDHERFGLPRKAGGRYFYTRNSGLQNQSALYVRDRLRGRARVLIDPNAWSRSGALALDAWQPSDDGKRLAYTVQENGSDWRVVRFLDVATGRLLPEELRGVKYSGLAWVGNTGVLYSRFPQRPPGANPTMPSFDQAVWFHRLGTAQADDELVYATPDRPEYGHIARVSADGRWAVISSSVGTAPRTALHAIDLGKLATRGWRPVELVKAMTDEWTFVDGLGSTLWFVTNADAPRYRLVALDLGARVPRLRPVIPQRTAKLAGANIVGNRLVLSYLEGGETRALVTDLTGAPIKGLALTGVGTASGFGGRPGDSETFYSFSSFAQPAAVYRLDLATGQSSAFALPALSYDPRDYLVERRFCTSRDGTRVPLWVVRSRAVAATGKPVPTLLYGYGGFDLAQNPTFSAARMAWLQSGGAFVLANLRGGGEYGGEWHDGGRLARKQNVFDDFIAAGEYLIASGIAPRGGLAIQGGSNGGLLVATVVNQRPGLFAAANPDVGVMDMLRFDRFTAGRYWTDDYGRPDNEADWHVLRTYSPYHNVRDGDYPAILVTTADTDDRVVPAHSFKYAAALQSAAVGGKPHLLRIEEGAGHGSGKPTDKVIEAGADVLAFLAYWSGLEIDDREPH